MTDLLPEPPYMYDDPRLTYDEQCLFYDGAGYDSVCLAGPTTVVVRPTGGPGSSGRKRFQNLKNLPYLNIFISTQLCQVNEEIFDEPAKIIRFTGEDTPISIFVNKVALDTRAPYVSGEIKKILDREPDFNASVEFVSNNIEKSDDEIVAQNLKTAMADIEVQVIEPFKEIKVQAELVKEEVDVSMSVTLIKKGDT